MIRFDRSAMRAGGGRGLVLDWLEAGFPAVDPQRCVEGAITVDGEAVRVGSSGLSRCECGRIVALAVGKAAVPMARGASVALGKTLSGGVVLAPYGSGGEVAGLRSFEAAHPIPDEAGRRGAAEIGRLADDAGRDDLVLCLLSGGGSALLAAPADGVALEELAETTRLLLHSGAPIDEVNAVRRHLSSMQGGRLAQRISPAASATFILSDVVGNRLESVASGPTVPDPSTFADALAVLCRHRLANRVPRSVAAFLARGVAGEVPETPKPGDAAFARAAVTVVGDNGAFLDAVARAARGAGCDVVRGGAPVTGEAREVGRALAQRAAALAHRRARRTLLLEGGETTVIVRGHGRGGRNQEAALAAAIEIAGVGGICVAALATDGVDGVTEAAGGIVDGGTVDAMRRAGVDPRAALSDNDAHTALAASRDLLATGATRTNVADVLVAYVEGGSGRSKGCGPIRRRSPSTCRGGTSTRG